MTNASIEAADGVLDSRVPSLKQDIFSRILYSSLILVIVTFFSIVSSVLLSSIMILFIYSDNSSGLFKFLFDFK